MMFKPMLAMNFDPKWHAEGEKVFIQEKIDGIRAYIDLRESVLKLRTRNQKEITSCDHILKPLYQDRQRLLEEGIYVLDGELYIPLGSFQETCSAVKRKKPNDLSGDVIFAIFDVLLEDELAAFSERYYKMISNVPRGWGDGCVVLAIDYPYYDGMAEELMEKARRFKIEGYMIRQDTPYDEGHRSKSVMKVKPFKYAKCKITDIVDGKGKDKGRAIVEFSFKGQKARARPAMDDYSRKEYYEGRDEYKNWNCLVQYQELTSKGVPRFPVIKHMAPTGEYWFDEYPDVEVL